MSRQHPSRPEPFTQDRGDHRTVIAQVWYPADPEPDAGTAPYSDDGTVAALSETCGFPEAAMFRFADAPTHAVPDAPLWTPVMQWSGLAGPVDPKRGNAAVTTWSRTFFDAHLKDRPSPLLEGASADWPEAGVERR